MLTPRIFPKLYFNMLHIKISFNLQSFSLIIFSHRRFASEDMHTLVHRLLGNKMPIYQSNVFQ